MNAEGDCAIALPPWAGLNLKECRHAAAQGDAHPHLSLGDRLCLALGDRVGGAVLTADRAWGSSRTVIKIR